MIDVMKRLAELDAKNSNIVKESQQPVEECGMMPMEKPHTPATMNITANSGEELGDMLSALMQLAGVHKVGDEHMGTEPKPTTMTAEPSMRSVIDKMHGDDGDAEIIHGDDDETQEGLVTTVGGAALGAKAGEVIGNMIAPGVGGALGSALGGLAGGYAGAKVEESPDAPGWYVTHEVRTGDPDRVAGPFADQQEAQAWMDDNLPPHWQDDGERYDTAEVSEEKTEEDLGGGIAGGLVGRGIGLAVPVPGASIAGAYIGSKLGSAASDALSGDKKEKPAETVDNMPTGIDDIPPSSKDAMLDKSRHNKTQSGYPGGDRAGNANNPRAYATMEDRLMAEYKQFIGESVEETETDEDVEEGVMDKVKKTASKVFDKLGGGNEEDLIKDLQKKAGVPQTGKKPEPTKESADDILKLAGLR